MKDTSGKLMTEEGYIHTFTFKIGTPEQRRELKKLLRSNKTIIVITSEYNSMNDEREVVIIRERK